MDGLPSQKGNANEYIAYKNSEYEENSRYTWRLEICDADGIRVMVQ
jgi:hypothetical protein